MKCEVLVRGKIQKGELLSISFAKAGVLIDHPQGGQVTVTVPVQAISKAWRDDLPAIPKESA